jgi:hypothetical protein
VSVDTSKQPSRFNSCPLGNAQPANERNAGDLSSKAAGLRLPDSTAELVLHADDRKMETDLAVDSVPEALARFRSAGGKVLAGPFDIQIGLCAVVSDPWENVLVILDASKGPLPLDETRRVKET